jgi:hypothetical protein
MGSVWETRNVSDANPSEKDQNGGTDTPVPPGSAEAEAKARKEGSAICVGKEECTAGTE